MLALKCMQSDPVKLLNVKLDLKEAISTANGIVKIKKKIVTLSTMTIKQFLYFW